jgi:hypothetical protein
MARFPHFSRGHRSKPQHSSALICSPVRPRFCAVMSSRPVNVSRAGYHTPRRAGSGGRSSASTSASTTTAAPANCLLFHAASGHQRTADQPMWREQRPAPSGFSFKSCMRGAHQDGAMG